MSRRFWRYFSSSITYACKLHSSVSSNKVLSKVSFKGHRMLKLYIWSIWWELQGSELPESSPQDMALKFNFRQHKWKIFTGLATILGIKFGLNESITDLFIKTDFILESNSRYKDAFFFLSYSVIHMLCFSITCYFIFHI